MRFGLRARLTLLIGGLVAALVTVTGVITTVREKRTLEIELRKRGTALAEDLAKFMLRPFIHRDLATLRRFVNDALEQDYVRYLYVLDPDGKVVMHNNLAEVGKTYEIGASATDAPQIVDARNPASGEQYCDISAPIRVADMRLGTIRLGYSYKAVEAEIGAARRQIIVIGAATILAGGVFAYFLAMFISAPVKMITEATRRVADGDLDFKLKLRREDEIGVLAHAFDTMTDDLRRTTTSRDFVDNIIGSLMDTLVVVDQEGQITRVNKALLELLGYEESEILGRGIGLLLPPAPGSRESNGLPGLLEEQAIANREAVYVARTGTRIPMLLSASRLESRGSEAPGAVVIGKDITLQKKAEEALRTSEQALHLLASQIMSAQEEERRRLARELHDELGQELMVLKLRIRAVREGVLEKRPGLEAACDEMTRSINELAESIRRISRDLSPAILEDLGLSAGIRWLVDRSIPPSGIAVSLDVDAVDDLFTEKERMTVYRIIQEGITNILKHAGASRMSLRLKVVDGSVLLAVEDNGQGFDDGAVSAPGAGARGMGLAAMAERARMLGGHIDVHSGKGSGTRIRVVFPMAREGRQG